MKALDVRKAALAAAGWLVASPALAWDVTNPTPRDQMREMATDRPDTTESAQTVDAGHVQVEMDLVAASLDDRPDGSSRSVALLATNFKVGLADMIDLQVVAEPVVFDRELAAGVAADTLDYGSTTVRLKVNFIGNDEGDVQLGMIPFVTHTPSSALVEGGLALVLGASLPEGFGIGAMLQGDVVAVDADTYEAEALATFTCGHDIVGPLAGYVEVAGRVRPYHVDRSAVSVHAGMTVDLGDDVQFDLGGRFGAYGDVPDAELFVGLSFRR